MSSSSIVGTTPISQGWHNYAIVKDGDSLKVYLDGILEMSGTQDLNSIAPTAILLFTDIIPDLVTSIGFTTRITGIKMWEAALSAAEVLAEVAGYTQVRTANSYALVQLKTNADLSDTSGNENNLLIDVNEPGVFDDVADGPFVPATSIEPHLATGNGVALSITDNLPINFSRQFTIMGWWRVRQNSSHTASFIRIANDDNVGGTAEMTLNLTSGAAAARVIFMDMNNGIVTIPTVTIVATPATPAAPIPSVVSLAASVVSADASFDVTAYLWELVSGPDTPTIALPAAATTNVTFTTFTPGRYTFRVTVSGINDFDGTAAGPFAASVDLTLPQGVAPTVQSGNKQTIYPAGVTLSPTIVDDGWDGSLTYAWTQVSGPGAATINSPAAASTTVDFPATQGTYLFQLRVDNDAFFGIGFWRVTVFTGAEQVVPEDVADTVVTVNGVEIDPLRQSTTINESVGSTPSTASFKTSNVPIEEGAWVTLDHGLAGRIFAGRMMRKTQQTFEIPANQLYDAQLNGPEWEMARRNVSRTWLNTSISEIAWDLGDLVPGLSTAGVPDGLPVLDQFTVDRKTVAEAYDELLKLLPNGHWKVGYDFVVTITTIEDTANDPLPITAQHPDLRSLVVMKDVSRCVSRLIVRGQNPAVTTEELNSTYVDEIEVDSLDNYPAGGGTAYLNGQEFTYTGTEEREVGSVVGVQSSFSAVPTFDISGQMGLLSGQTYGITYSTKDGETPLNSGIGGIFLAGSKNAFDVVVQGIDANADGGTFGIVTGINIYRLSNEFGTDGRFHFVNNVGRGGGVIRDTLSLSELLSRSSIPNQDTSGETKYYLTGLTGLQRSTKTVDGVKYQFTLDDLTAQAILAAKFGIGDDGVIEAPLDVGILPPDQALIQAKAYLEQRNEIDVQVKYKTRDYKPHPGQTLTVYLTDDRDVQDDFKIQQTTITNFESGLSPWYEATASKKVPLVRFESLLRKTT